MDGEITTGPWPGNYESINSPLLEIAKFSSFSEGTWLPKIGGSPTQGDGTYNSQHGKWIKVGSLVHLMFAVSHTAHTGTIGSSFYLYNLPFPISDSPSSLGLNFAIGYGDLVAGPPYVVRWYNSNTTNTAMSTLFAIYDGNNFATLAANQGYFGTVFYNTN